MIVRILMPKNSLELRLLKEQQAKLSALRAALVEGEDSGSSTAFDFDRFIASRREAGSSSA
jgi:antitoxin ParD1/3/4